MSEPTQYLRTTPTPPQSGGRRSPDGRWKAIGVIGIIILVLAALLAAVTVAGDGTAQATDATDAASVQPTTTSTTADGTSPDPATVSDDLDDATEAALEADDDSTGYPDSGQNVSEPPSSDDGDGPVELDPVGDVDADCASVLATGASLLVTPDPAVLEPGTMNSALTVRNCDDAAVDWTAKTVPHVALDTAGSTLAAGTTTQLGFTIDADAYEPGAVDFKVKVSEPGHNHYVDVHAFRKTVGKDLVAGNGSFSAGEEAGGCANSCITMAWLTPNANTPNLGFEVKTNTPAKIRVWVGTGPQNGAGTPMASSAPGTTHWTTVLKPLQPATQYHLLLKATDGNGKTDSRSTTFTTVTPLDNPDDLAPVDPKCLAQCISKAVVSPGGDFSVRHLEVASKTPARFQVRVSTESPTDHDGHPGFDHADVIALSGLEYHQQWSTDLQPLAGDTTYHIIVQATDTDGHTAYQVGSFHTAPEPTHDVVITFHKVTVTYDGDSSWHNRGELSFAWGVGDTTIGTRAESKMSDGDSFGFDPWKSVYAATGLHDDDFLPTVYVSGSERDPDGKSEFCAMGTGVAHDWGHNDTCDAKWNVASSGIVSVASIDSLTRCSEFGLDGPAGDEGCVLLETVDHGDDYARFQVVVSYHVAD